MAPASCAGVKRRTVLIVSETDPSSGSRSVDEHRRLAREARVRCAVVTVSDTRTPETDSGGDLIRQRLHDAGHEVVRSIIVNDEPDQVAHLLDGHFADAAQAVLFTGGTGISERDRTYEAISGRLERTLPGFGEIFRMLSFAEIGAAAMLSRAVAGTHRGRLVVCMPGSPNAVRLAMDRLVVPELAHLVWELTRHR